WLAVLVLLVAMYGRDWAGWLRAVVPAGWRPVAPPSPPTVEDVAFELLRLSAICGQRAEAQDGASPEWVAWLCLRDNLAELVSESTQYVIGDEDLAVLAEQADRSVAAA